MKTSCKSCQNWKPVSEERGWCANFAREMMNNTTCGEWRARRLENKETSPKEGTEEGYAKS